MRSETHPTPAPARPRRARRRFGQHFLTSRDAAERIAEALSPVPGEAVLEIGPGAGAITAPLLERAGRIAAVEIDRDLAADLGARFPAPDLLILERDVLEVSFREVLLALGRAEGERLAIAGNLPYNISKPVAMKLVRERESIDRAVLTFQREVAERLLASPGSRHYGPLTVLAGLAFEITRLFDLPPSAFRPRPKVVSTVTRFAPRRDIDLGPELEGRLRVCLAASFASRRKTMLANLRAALPGGAEAALALLALARLDSGARAETIPPEGFVNLARLWPERSPGGA
jgi:16S rRNA (adenine1518-N6/adenine1519-N6)-dimethyltransferase